MPNEHFKRQQCKKMPPQRGCMSFGYFRHLFQILHKQNILEINIQKWNIDFFLSYTLKLIVNEKHEFGFH